ncbi:putative WRKY transcription factor 28 [Hibiscus syriacus]|uniref:WRKY transcription factor 28 n=1 Tax=Hibiscus syriacus TaxID=106335 RepID=A0A6A3CE69_HIBSY|nr:probable WRKY transcription factor 13 [Hibiscus syriacus]KAE8725439.1 putative WRKY transcription factor 28 [Hibiscus syriacus]
MSWSSHQAQGLFDEKEKLAAVSQMDFFTFPQNPTSSCPLPFAYHHPCLKPFDIHELLHLTQSQTQLLSLQTSTANFRAWGDDCLGSKKIGVEDHPGVSAKKMKRIKARRKVREPRFCFKTMSDVDVLDDGYKWRKYGQKVVKNTHHPRSYYRCTQDNCRVKKRVERSAEDPRMVITSYEGRHAHSPPRDLDDMNNSDTRLNNLF